MTLLVSFGGEISQIFSRIFLFAPPPNIPTEFVNPQRPVSLFWPVLVSGVTIWTTLTTYGIGGAARHGKQGWRFVQPWSGGVRFVFVQILTWITAALSIGMPWTTLPKLGWLLPWIGDTQTDPVSHRGLLVVGSALGMLSNTFCVLGLMSFNPDENMQNIDSKTFDVGKWSWNIFGDSLLYWYLFLTLQGTFVVFSWELAVMLEMSQSLKNNIVESLLLIVISSLIAVPLGLTNAVAGKWRHGERIYRLTMPCEGGAIFVTLQAIGWTLFSLSFVMTLLKLVSVISNTRRDQLSISVSAFAGLLSYFFILASLFWFDPSKVHEQDSDSEETLKARTKAAAKRYLKSLKRGFTPKSDKGSSRKSKTRSVSPKFRKATRPKEDQKEEDVPIPEEMQTRNEDEDCEEDSDIWEEVEDENGNVYFFNEKKNISQTTVPRHLRRVLGQS